MGIYPAKLGIEGMLHPSTKLTLSGWGVTNVLAPGLAEGSSTGPVGSAAAGSVNGDRATADRAAGEDFDVESDGVDSIPSASATPAGEETSIDDNIYDDTYDDHYDAYPAARKAVAPPYRPLPVMLRQAGDGGGGAVVTTPSPTAELTRPGTLLTTRVKARPMGECASFAEEEIGVSSFSTSLYDGDRQICLSLRDNVGACDGDR